MLLVPRNTPPVSMRMLLALMSPSIRPLARISRWPEQNHVAHHGARDDDVGAPDDATHDAAFAHHHGRP